MELKEGTRYLYMHPDARGIVIFHGRTEQGEYRCTVERKDGVAGVFNISEEHFKEYFERYLVPTGEEAERTIDELIGALKEMKP